MEKTILLLPETDDRTLCLEMRGNIALRDFQDSFEAPLRAIIARQGSYNIFAVYTDDNARWQEDAAHYSFRFYNEIGPLRHRVAFVNAPDSRHLITKILQPVIINGEARFFDPDQRDEALTWVKGQS